MTNQAPFEREHDQLIDHLKGLSLHTPPAELVTRVMTGIERHQPPLMHRLLRQSLIPISRTLRPALAVCMVVMVIGAFALGRYSARSIDNAPLQLTDAEAAYLAGRELLSSEKRADALTLLQHAATLAPGNPEFALWEGIAHWTNDQPEQERASYLRGLHSAPDSIPLLINLGHHHLSNGAYNEALDAYHKVLAINPDEPTAWYNCGLIYRILERKQEEADAWKNYLHRQRLGIRAVRAVERLNDAGDFSYRSFWIGPRRVIIHTGALLSLQTTAAEQRHEAALLATLLTENETLTLTITTFSSGNKERARNRALLLKSMIAAEATGPVKGRISVSWFDSPETIPLPGNKERTHAEGLLLFGSSDHHQEREVSI